MQNAYSEVHEAFNVSCAQNISQMSKDYRKI